jgi:hypothetical protein
LSKSIDFLLLSNRIADDIAAKLHWSANAICFTSLQDLEHHGRIIGTRETCKHFRTASIHAWPSTENLAK